MSVCLAFIIAGPLDALVLWRCLGFACHCLVVSPPRTRLRLMRRKWKAPHPQSQPLHSQIPLQMVKLKDMRPRLA